MSFLFLGKWHLNSIAQYNWIEETYSYISLKLRKMNLDIIKKSYREKLITEVLSGRKILRIREADKNNQNGRDNIGIFREKYQVHRQNLVKEYLVYQTKKWRKAEYVQRRVWFVNVQVPWPNSNTYVKLSTSRLCMKMSSNLFVRAWAMPRIFHLSCGVSFPVWTPENISLISVVPWLSRWEVI